MGEMAELRTQFYAELDFRREAKVMDQVASNLRGPFPRIAVPRSHPTLVSENVLVMGELAGGSLLDGLKRMAQAYAEAQGISVEDLKEQMLEHARSSGDSDAAPGPGRFKLALLQGYVKTSTLVSNTGVALYNSSIGRITSVQPKKYQTAPPMINIEKTVRTLCAVLGHQVLPHLCAPACLDPCPSCLLSTRCCGTLVRVSPSPNPNPNPNPNPTPNPDQVLRDGLFSSDPHPGNVMLLHDGRIGLIDFGQAKYLTTAQRLQVARTVPAVAVAVALTLPLALTLPRWRARW
jgi:hypothetical protein